MFEIGDKVHWTKTIQSKKTISMQRMDGVVVSISGKTAEVRLKSGRITKVSVALLRDPSQKSGVTDFVEAVVEANREKRTCVL